MKEERLLILQMVKEGKISIDEGMTLLDSLEKSNVSDENDLEKRFSLFLDEIKNESTDLYTKFTEMLKNFDFEDIRYTAQSTIDDMKDTIKDAINRM